MLLLLLLGVGSMMGGGVMDGGIMGVVHSGVVMPGCGIIMVVAVPVGIRSIGWPGLLSYVCVS